MKRERQSGSLFLCAGLCAMRLKHTRKYAVNAVREPHTDRKKIFSARVLLYP